MRDPSVWYVSQQNCKARTKNVTRGGAQHHDQHGKTMRVELLRSSTEGVANIEKDGNEVLTGGDEVRGDDALTLQSTATFCYRST